MEHVENGAATRMPINRSGKDRRRQNLPFPQSDELRHNPERRNSGAAVKTQEPFWESAETSLLRFLGRY